MEEAAIDDEEEVWAAVQSGVADVRRAAEDRVQAEEAASPVGGEEDEALPLPVRVVGTPPAAARDGMPASDGGADGSSRPHPHGDSSPGMDDVVKPFEAMVEEEEDRAEEKVGKEGRVEEGKDGVRMGSTSVEGREVEQQAEHDASGVVLPGQLLTPVQFSDEERGEAKDEGEGQGGGARAGIEDVPMKRLMWGASAEEDEAPADGEEAEDGEMEVAAPAVGGQAASEAPSEPLGLTTGTNTKNVPFEWRLLNVATGEEAGEQQPQGWGATGYLDRQRGRMYRLEELKKKLEASTVPKYSSEMASKVDEMESVSIMQIPAEQIRMQEREVEEARVAEAQAQVERQRRRLEKVKAKEEESKVKIVEEEEAKRVRIEVEKQQAVAIEKSRQKNARVALRQGKEEVEIGMKKKSDKLKKSAGVLVGDRTGNLKLLSTWKLSAALNRAPQPIKIHLKSLRGAKDRLPRGHYVMLVSLVEKVGGEKLKWSGGGDHTNAKSRPKQHLARFYDVSIDFEEHVFILVPPKADARPGMCLLFELVQCKSRLINDDTCVGWGLFPLYGTRRELLDGKYRFPMIKGDYESWDVEQHKQLEDAVRSGLHNWVGNLYFRVSLMSRYLHGHRERALRLHHTSDLLGFEPPMDELSLPDEREERDGLSFRSGRSRTSSAAGSNVGRSRASDIESRVIGGRKKSRDGGRSGGATPLEGGATPLECASRSGSQAGSARGESEAPEGGSGAAGGGVREGQGEGKKAGVVARVVRAVRVALGKEEAGGEGHNLKIRLKRMWSGAGNEDGDGGGDEEKEEKEVNWSKVFLGEKLKVETGWDPEGDGLSDVSDSEDENDDKLPIELAMGLIGGGGGGDDSGIGKGKKARIALRSETGGLVVLKKGGEGDEERSGDEVPEEDDLLGQGDARIPRPIDEGKHAMIASVAKEKQQNQEAAAAGGGGSGGGAKGGGGEGGKPKQEERRLLKEPSVLPTKNGGNRLLGEPEVVKGVLKDLSGGSRSVHLDVKKPGVVAVSMDPRLAMHSISCLNPLNKRDHEHSFLLDEISSDIGLNKWRWPPWRPLSTLLIAFVSFIIRVQLHYMGMAGMLLLLQRPVYEMKGDWYRWTIKYSPIANQTSNEFAMLTIGTCVVFFFWGVTAFATFAAGTVFKVEPIVYTFVCISGILASLDPLLIIIVDALSGNLDPCLIPDSSLINVIKDASLACNANVMRLWFHFRVNEGNGSTGLAMVIFVYLGMMGIMSVFVYTVMLNVHHRGRILDTFRRLTASEDALLCPLDSEISLRQLKEILSSSKRSHRQIIVTDLLVTYLGLDEAEIPAPDQEDKMYDEKYTHIGVYNSPEPTPGTSELPERTLYRHFVKLPDGAIVELLGSDAPSAVSKKILNRIRMLVGEAAPATINEMNKKLGISGKGWKAAKGLVKKPSVFKGIGSLLGANKTSVLGEVVGEMASLTNRRRRKSKTLGPYGGSHYNASRRGSMSIDL